MKMTKEQIEQAMKNGATTMKTLFAAITGKASKPSESFRNGVVAAWGGNPFETSKTPSAPKKSVTFDSVLNSEPTDQPEPQPEPKAVKKEVKKAKKTEPKPQPPAKKTAVPAEPKTEKPPKAPKAPKPPKAEKPTPFRIESNYESLLIYGLQPENQNILATAFVDGYLAYLSDIGELHSRYPAMNKIGKNLKPAKVRVEIDLSVLRNANHTSNRGRISCRWKEKNVGIEGENGKTVRQKSANHMVALYVRSMTSDPDIKRVKKSAAAQPAPEPAEAVPANA